MLEITRVKIFAHRFLLARNKIGIANGSNIQWRGRSYAASVPSDVPKSQSTRRKVSKEERKAMVETFVKTYRAAHDGKFPTASVLKKNVGGSYYVIRIMLQELEYKSKTYSTDGGTKTLGNGPTKKHEESMDAAPENEVYIVAGDNVEIGDASEKHLEAEGSPLPSSVAKWNSFEEVEKPTALGSQSDPFGVQSNLIIENNKDVNHSDLGKSEHENMEGAHENPVDFVASEKHPVREEGNKTFHQVHDTAENPKKEEAEVHDTAENRKKEEAEGVSSYFVATGSQPLKGEIEKVSDPSFGNADEKEEKVPSKDLMKSDGTKHEAEQHKGSPEPVKYETDISSRQTEGTEAARKSTLWENLKSLADGFFRMWK